MEHEPKINKLEVSLLIVVSLALLFNQWQVSALTSTLDGVGSSHGSRSYSFGSSGGSADLSSVDINQIQSTAQGIAALYDFGGISDTQDLIDLMIATGTPTYGEAMGVSFDDPVAALGKLAGAYPALNQQVKQDPELWARYLNLAGQPRGVSCEFCCGVGAQGVDKNGRSRCGCKHNPAVLSLTQWLLLNTDYSDAEILKEVYDWKTLFFPKNMVGLASQIAGGDTSVLNELPGMVGGC